MLTFRDVQNVVIDRALREARRQLPLDAQIGREITRQGSPPQAANRNTNTNVLRADAQALDAPGVVLGE
jgi:hypothetical protein